jgi:hypothetical protein
MKRAESMILWALVVAIKEASKGWKILVKWPKMA